MNDIPVAFPDPVSRFYDKYLKCLVKASIPERQRPWYVKHVEAFIKAQNGCKIKLIPRDGIDRYLELIGRKNRLEGWQFHQCIDAIRILYCQLLQSPACHDVDWQYWYDSAKQLEIDHPTTARQYSPEQLSYLKSRKGNGSVTRSVPPIVPLSCASHGKSVGEAMPIEPSRVTRSGSVDSYGFAAGDIPMKPDLPKCVPIWSTWPCEDVSAPVRKTRRSMHWSFSLSGCLNVTWVNSNRLSVPSGDAICPLCSAGVRPPHFSRGWRASTS